MACASEPGSDPTCLPGGVRSLALQPWHCPRGWTEDAVMGCAPTLRVDCPSGSGPLPDGTCTPTGGDQCGAAEFPPVPDGTSADRAIYVRALAPPGGSGSVGAPLRTLAEAMAVASDGGAILLADGDYEVMASIRRRLVIRGRCADRVRLRSSQGTSNAPIFELDGREAQLDLSGVNVLINDGTGISATGHSFVRIHHARTHIGRGYLVTTTDATSEVEDLLHENDPSSEFSLVVQNLRGSSVIRRTSTRGVRAGAYINQHIPSQVLFSDSVVDSSGFAFRSFPVSSARIDRVVIRGAAGESVIGWGGGPLYAADLFLRGGIGIGGGSFIGSRISIQDGTLEVRNTGASSRVDELSVRWSDEAVRPDGHCMTAFLGGRSFASRARLFDCVEGSAYAYATGSIELWDSLLRAPRADQDGFLGVGAQAAVAGEVRLERTVIERARMAGAVAIHLKAEVLARLNIAALSPEFGPRIQASPSYLSFEDLVIRDTQNVPGRVSVGLAASANSLVVGRRLALLGQQGAAILASDTGFDREYIVGGVSRTFHWDRTAEAIFRGSLPLDLDGPSRMVIDGLFVGPVRSSPILYDPETRSTRADSMGAFGAFVSPGCSLEASGAYFDGRDLTDSALVSQGTLRVTRGHISGTTRCAGQRSTATAAQLGLDSVTLDGNVRNEVCVDTSLPNIRLPMSPN